MASLNALTRRSTLALLGAAVLPSLALGQDAGATPIKVYKDPACACCSGWVRHLQDSGFAPTVVVTTEMAQVKARLGVADDLASCHTAEVGGYVVEGHVPASAIRRLLSEKPAAAGLAAPGMPSGAPGMGGPSAPYEVILFGPSSRRTYMRFVGDREA